MTSNRLLFSIGIDTASVIGVTGKIFARAPLGIVVRQLLIRPDQHSGSLPRGRRTIRWSFPNRAFSSWFWYGSFGIVRDALVRKEIDSMGIMPMDRDFAGRNPDQ
jgi:hypothetical protein